jgi:hypothetical protein
MPAPGPGVKRRPAALAPDGDRLTPRPGRGLPGRMSTPTHPNTGQPKPPTARQLRYLRVLALERGVTFPQPRSRAEASSQIAAIRAMPPDSRSDADGDLEDVVAEMQAANHHDAAHVRDDEITGYGAHAHWAGGGET